MRCSCCVRITTSIDCLFHQVKVVALRTVQRQQKKPPSWWLSCKRKMPLTLFVLVAGFFAVLIAVLIACMTFFSVKTAMVLEIAMS